MRGEQPRSSAVVSATSGSPPLARGTDKCIAYKKVSLGITPACAGNSYPSLKCGYAHWDHPRLRGEQVKECPYPARRTGSPPLARGTGQCCGVGHAAAGITPACAGNSSNRGRTCGLSRDHPRLRGEQFSCGHTATVSLGSPPLARGTAIKQGAKAPKGGITPACAGNRRTGMGARLK